MTDTIPVTIDDKHVVVVASANHAFWELCSSGKWERETFVIFRHFLDRAHTYIDMGSWIGPTVLFGCGLSKQVHAIEPDPLAFEELGRNVEANRPATANVQLHNVCIAASSGEVGFGSRTGGGDSTSSMLFSDGATQWRVAALSFHDFAKRVDLDHCNFIKMDIEGGEYSVLPSMRAFLEDSRPTVYLSLHPGFLEKSGPGLASAALRGMRRLQSTARLLWSLKSYRHLYDPRGRVRPVSAPRTWKGRLHERVARVGWKPFAILRTTAYGVAGINSTLVATDLEWRGED